MAVPESEPTALMERMDLEYGLKNEPKRIFKVAVEAEGDSQSGVAVRARVTPPDVAPYRVEVKLAPGYTSTKPHLSLHELMLTAVELVKGHIESHRHQDYRVELVENSGLPRSQPASLTW